MKILGYDISFTKAENKAQNTPPNAKATDVIKTKFQLYRITTDLSKFRTAVLSAESIDFPQRYQLLQLYQQTILDPHVSACFEQRNNLVLGAEFCVYNKDGSDNEEKSKIFKQKWFRDYLLHVLESIDYGHSLIQFEDIVKVNGIEKFKEVELVPRQYVKPEFDFIGSMISSMPPDGVFYTDEPYSNWCIGVGSKRDLGLLLKLTPLVIWKKNAMGAWAEYIEKFGVPIRVGHTDSLDKKSTDAMEDMFAKMSIAPWGVFKKEDKIEVLETSKTDAYMVFDEMINRCNSEISKLILMQTGTTDEKSFVGSAEVHERILKQVGNKLRKMVFSVNNDQLLPLMNNLGFGLDGLYLDIEQEDEFNLEQKSKFDIELIKTGKFTFDPKYIKEKYGTEVIEVKEPVEPKTVKTLKNSLDDIYS